MFKNIPIRESKDQKKINNAITIEVIHYIFHRNVNARKHAVYKQSIVYNGTKIANIISVVHENSC